MRLLLTTLAGAALVAMALVGWQVRNALPRADLVWVNGTDPASLDPAQVTGAPEGRLLRALYEGLTTLDPLTLAPAPGVATAWECSVDGLAWSFVLRPDARWSDGSPVTAHDFVYSWLRLLDPATGGKYAQLLWPLCGARAFNSGKGPREAVALHAPDPHLLQLSLEQPVPHLPELTAFFALYPVQQAAVEAAARAGVSFTTPARQVSNGPFHLTARRLRDRLRLERSPFYWNATEVTLERVDVLSVESEMTALNLLLSGEADWIVRVPRVVLPALVSDPRWAERFQPVPYFATAFVRVNTTRPPLDDARVRRALALAIDREELVERVLQAGERPAHSFVPWPAAAVAEHSSWQQRHRRCTPVASLVASYERALLQAASTSPETPWGRRAHDPGEARALLAECGYSVPDGRGGVTPGSPLPPLEFLFNSNPLNERVAELLQAQWRRELGLDLRLAQQEWGSVLASMRALDYHLARSSWIGDFLDPLSFLDILRSDDANNRTGWRDPTYDALLAEAARMPDRARRYALLHQAEELLMRSLPVLPLYYHVTDGMVQPGLQGVGGNALDVTFPGRVHWATDAGRPRR